MNTWELAEAFVLFSHIFLQWAAYVFYCFILMKESKCTLMTIRPYVRKV